MKKKSPDLETGAIDLLEEAVHLLRTTPAGLYAAYALGTLPFVLAFLYFWAEMSRGAYARDFAGPAALAMGLLYLWMKCWQAVFAGGLRSLITGRPGASWSLRRAGALILTQCALQPSALFAVPLALAILLPFAWVFSFYQNATVLGGDSRGLGETSRVASAQASYQPGLSWFLLGLLGIFTLFVWLNVALTLAVLPQLLKSLLGIDTTFTQAGWRSIVNTTYFACSLGLTYVFVAPLIMAVFALRCFYGQSVQTGDDIKSELARVRAPVSPALAALAALVMFSFHAPVLAAESPPPPVVISPTQLNHSIDNVLKRDEFAWRMPRQEIPDKPSDRHTWLARFVGGIVDSLKEFMGYCGESLGNFVRWLGRLWEKLWPDRNPSPDNGHRPSVDWQSLLQILLLLLITVIACWLALLIFRMVNSRRKKDEVVTEAVLPTPDLNDEHVAANQLPEDEWLRLARELMAQGDFRLALRALYLAGLAHLAEREFIAIARFKSNREYESELVRRGRALPEVQAAFSQNVAAFDRVWYGLHEVTREGLDAFQSNLDRIRAC